MSLLAEKEFEDALVKNLYELNENIYTLYISEYNEIDNLCFINSVCNYDLWIVNGFVFGLKQFLLAVQNNKSHVYRINHNHYWLFNFLFFLILICLLNDSHWIIEDSKLSKPKTKQSLFL